MSPTDLDHQALKESTGLYVVGALPADEREAFERHLRSCDECAAEVRSLRSVADALPYALPQVDPPNALRARVLAAAGQEDQSRVVVADKRQAATPINDWQSRSGWLSAAALLVVAVGVSGYALTLRQRVGGLELQLQDALARVTRSEQQLATATASAARAEVRLAVITAPDLAQVALAGQPPSPRASGRAFWSRTRGLMFAASNLPPLPSNRIYQFWVVTATSAISSGWTFRPDESGRAAEHFATAPDIPPPVAMAVTIEPEGGVSAPTGDKVLVGTTQ